MKRVLLIRHGQTEWNILGRWQGALDVPLNAVGEQQAQTVAAYLKDRPITAVYTSDLARAANTAAAIAAARGLTAQPEMRLRELDLGVFQGLTREEIAAQYPDELAAMQADYMGFVIPQGESRQIMQDRAYEAWQSIVPREAGPEIVMVAHGGTIRVLLMKLFPERDDARHAEIKNTSISTITVVENGTMELTELAATPHLDTIESGRGESANI
ncbi:MAG: histidine phosphatase family protein [Chloroflexi bacterium]|nr:histidine phosphatase family protein [Chloroflexota bacterium]